MLQKGLEVMRACRITPQRALRFVTCERPELGPLPIAGTKVHSFKSAAGEIYGVERPAANWVWCPLAVSLWRHPMATLWLVMLHNCSMCRYSLPLVRTVFRFSCHRWIAGRASVGLFAHPCCSICIHCFDCSAGRRVIFYMFIECVFSFLLRASSILSFMIWFLCCDVVRFYCCCAAIVVVMLCFSICLVSCLCMFSFYRLLCLVIYTCVHMSFYYKHVL